MAVPAPRVPRSRLSCGEGWHPSLGSLLSAALPTCTRRTQDARHRRRRGVASDRACFAFQETRQRTKMAFTGSRAAPRWTSSKTGGSKSVPWRWSVTCSHTRTSQVCGSSLVPAPCREAVIPAAGCQQQLSSDLRDEAGIPSALPSCMALCEGTEAVPLAPPRSAHHASPRSL